MLGMRMAAHAVGWERGLITTASNHLALEPVLPRYCLPAVIRGSSCPCAAHCPPPWHAHTRSLQPVVCGKPLERVNRCRS